MVCFCSRDRRWMYMQIKCNEGKFGCPFRGDLPEICLDYRRGEHNRDSIIAHVEFPALCRDCRDRDVDFCGRHGDLICLKNQNPYDCKIDLTNETIRGVALIQMSHDAIQEARLKRNWQYKKEDEKQSQP